MQQHPFGGGRRGRGHGGGIQGNYSSAVVVAVVVRDSKGRRGTVRYAIVYKSTSARRSLVLRGWRHRHLLHGRGHVHARVPLLLLQLSLDGQLLPRKVIQLIDRILQGDNNKSVVVVGCPFGGRRLMMMRRPSAHHLYGRISDGCDGGRLHAILRLRLLFGVFQRKPEAGEPREEAALALL